MALPFDLAQLTPLATRLAVWLHDQRWFGGKGRPIERVRFDDYALLADGPSPILLGLVAVEYADGPAERYFVPLALRRGEAGPLGRLDLAGDSLAVDDALAEPACGQALLAAVGRSLTLSTACNGAIAFERGPAFEALAPPDAAPAVRPLGVEQSNTSVVLGEALVMKCFRRVYDGPNPDLEVPRFLATQTSFDRLPELAGSIDYADPDGTLASLGIVQEFVHSQGDGWSYTLQALESGRGSSPEYLAEVAALGRVTAELHLALSSGTQADFTPEPITEQDIERWRTDIVGWVERSCDSLRRAEGKLSASTLILARQVLDRRDRLVARADSLAALRSSAVRKIRYHGDYHLGQVLETESGWVVLDFEGEPLRSLADRRARHCPLKDVAGLLRSLSYARQAALRASPAPDRLGDDLAGWEQTAQATYLEAYLQRAGRAVFLPRDPQATRQVLQAFQLEKAAYELQYELNNRPDWVEIPLVALAQLTD